MGYAKDISESKINKTYLTNKIRLTKYSLDFTYRFLIPLDA